MRRSTLEDKGGVITERETHFITVRLRIPAGVISPSKMRGIADIASRYGAGIALTVRQTIELYHVPPSSLHSLVFDLEKNGTPLGSEKAEIVNITACPGTDRCIFGQIDSLYLAKEIDAAHFGREMPTKTRIAISSCPYSCMSERLCEIGITGVVRPYRKPGECTGCDSCTQYCKEGAITIRNGDLTLDMEKCILCGMCVLSCPRGIIHADPPAYQITIGGRKGMYPAIGRHLVTVKSADKALVVVNQVIEWIYRTAWEGSLLQDQLDDLDFDRFKAGVISGLAPDEIETGC
jgi:dissimilatory sulfite reductase (desulfoviridin) alpha/beta subunit